MTMMTAPPTAANPAEDAAPGRYAGVDTHKDTHHVAVVDELGRAVADQQFPATSAGYRQILDFLHTAGPIRAVGVEGTGSYGAELARVMTAAGMTVIEVMRTNRQHRRIKGKFDPLDAEQAALTVAAGRATVVPKQRDGRVEYLRILLAERTSATKARAAVLNQIHALLITAPDAVRVDYRRYHGSQLVAVLARTRPGAGHDPEHVARASLKRLAIRHRNLVEEITVVDNQLEQIVAGLNPALLATHGVGPVVAATLLATVGDNPARIRTPAAFAALCRVAPVPASSGRTRRHRLSRGGDRQANHALHRIVLLRMRTGEPRTMAYFLRRRAEGLADRDIIRCLKRHVANEVFAVLTHPPTEPLPGPLLRRQRQALGIPPDRSRPHPGGALPAVTAQGAGHPHRSRPRPPLPALTRRDRPTTPQNRLTPIGASKSVTNVYPAFKTTGTGNTFTGCRVSYLWNQLPTFAFEDTVNTSDSLARNTYTGCVGDSAQAVFKDHDYMGFAFSVPNHPVRVTAGTVVPVDKSGFQVLNYAAATTISDFTGGHWGADDHSVIHECERDGGTRNPDPYAVWQSDGFAGEHDVSVRPVQRDLVRGPRSDPVFTSPNGTLYRLTVADDGTLGTSTT